MLKLMFVSLQMAFPYYSMIKILIEHQLAKVISKNYLWSKQGNMILDLGKILHLQGLKFRHLKNSLTFATNMKSIHT